jgi:hypothetical protein
MRFTIYIPKEHEPSFNQFVKSQECPSRRICRLVKGDLDNLNINILRSILKNNSLERRRVKELLEEFEKV